MARQIKLKLTAHPLAKPDGFTYFDVDENLNPLEMARVIGRTLHPDWEEDSVLFVFSKPKEFIPILNWEFVKSGDLLDLDCYEYASPVSEFLI